jgi:hypothetical protein
MSIRNLYWSRYNAQIDTDFEKWKHRTAELSQLHKLTLSSHLRLGGEIILHTHQKIEAPEGITICDAEKYISSEIVFRALQGGHSIAHVSDAVRLGACLDNGGIFIDMDMTVLREFPDDEGFIHSAPAKKTGGFAPKWGASHPPIFIRDGSWDGKALAMPPFKVSPQMRDGIKLLCKRIVNELGKPPKKDTHGWNYVMWDVKHMARTCSDVKVYPPLYGCPIPSWLGEGKCYSLEQPTRMRKHNILFGHQMDDADVILSKSHGIQHFMESAFQEAEVVPDDFWMNVPQESLLAMEAMMIVGQDWKDLFTSHPYSYPPKAEPS